MQPRRVRSPKNVCKSDDIIGSVMHIIRRLRIAMPARSDDYSSRSMLYRFFILYGSLYAGFGVQSPYLPILLDNRHLRPETIALALAAGTAMRLMAAQAVARLADCLDAPKVILAVCTTAAALIGLGY